MTTRCAIVGATGVAGQQFLAALAKHPFLTVVRLAASARSAGRTYREAITQSNGQLGWYVEASALSMFADRRVEDAASMSLDDVDLVFSAIESDAARELEATYAKRVPVISTASAYRYEPDVPILIPAVNGSHAPLVRTQKAKRGWDGFVVPIPNCTTTGLAIALAPIHAHLGIERVVMTSMQATSGAGRSPGVIALDIVDNLIPFIPKEEEKVERETRKLLGTLGDSGIEDAPFRVSATCTRVAVLDGHTEAVTVATRGKAEIDELVRVMQSFGKDVNPGTHPSAPQNWITVHTDPFRPQPRFDRDADRGMTTHVGRLRADDVLGAHGFRFVLLSHNTKMGAAQGAMLVAEDLKIRGLLG